MRRKERSRRTSVPTRLHPGERAGVLLLGHGASQSKDETISTRARSPKLAAETGLAGVCIDAINHCARLADTSAHWPGRRGRDEVADWQKNGVLAVSRRARGRYVLVLMDDLRRAYGRGDAVDQGRVFGRRRRAFCRRRE